MPTYRSCGGRMCSRITWKRAWCPRRTATRAECAAQPGCGVDNDEREAVMKKILAASVVLALAPVTQSFAQHADVAAGKAKVEEVCSACHGLNGVSVSDTIPNLAAQREAYIASQLRA